MEDENKEKTTLSLREEREKGHDGYGHGGTKTGVMGSTLALLFMTLGDTVDHCFMLGYLAKLVLTLREEMSGRRERLRRA